MTGAPLRGVAVGAVGLALLVVAALPLPPAAAQAGGSTTTTTGSTSPLGPTTTAPSSSTTTATTAPPSTLGSPPPTEPAPAPVDAVEEDGAESSPAPLPVPPRAAPRVITPTDGAVTKVVTAEIRAAQAVANKALADSGAADQALAGLEARQTVMQSRYDALHADDARAARQLQQHRNAVRTRAVALYVSGGTIPLVPVGADIDDYGRKRVLIDALHKADERATASYKAAKAAAGDEVTRLVRELEDLNGQVMAARANAGLASERLLQARNALAGLRAGGQVAINGFVFPVASPHSFVDTFGAPRMTGTPYAHQHQGTDIFAPYGTPLFACERGIIFKMGSDRLGGTKLWVGGESGTTYYYAHLSAFADGLDDGQVVEAGDLVGYVGNSGNAATTPPHLHFEIHPGAGAAINPYPTLKTVDDAVKQFGPRVPTTSAPPVTVATAAGP